MADFLEDMYTGGRGLLDMVGAGEAISLARTGTGLTHGAEKVMGPLGYLTSGIDLLSGGYNLAKGVSNDDDVAIANGVHDTLGGTAGMLGNIPGPVGQTAKAFSAGYAVGDVIAPYVFGSEEEANRPHTEEIPAIAVSYQMGQAG